MALTLVQLAEAIVHDVGKPDAHSVAKVIRNATLLHDRLVTVEPLIVAARKALADDPPEPSTGPLTPVQIALARAKFVDAMNATLIAKGRPIYTGEGGPGAGALNVGDKLAIVDRLGINREITAYGEFGEPGDTPGADYSAFTAAHALNDSSGEHFRVWRDGQLIADELATPGDDLVQFAKRHGVDLPVGTFD